MLALSDFMALSLSHQLACIRENGKYRSTRLFEHYCINLYSVGDYFAEVWYDPKGNYIHLISSFGPTAVSAKPIQVQVVDSCLVA